MKFKGVIATTNVDLQGEQFTPEALQQLADTAVGKPIKWNFETELPGKITNAYVEGNQLVAEGELTIDLFLVPGFIRQDDGEGELEMFALGLTSDPADPTLPPLKVEPAAFPWRDIDAVIKEIAKEEDAHFLAGIGAEKRQLLPGVECSPGCAAHVSHPCEKCGRYAAGLPAYNKKFKSDIVCQECNSTAVESGRDFVRFGPIGPEYRIFYRCDCGKTMLQNIRVLGEE